MIILLRLMVVAILFTGCFDSSAPTPIPVVYNDPLEKEQWYLDSLKVRDVNVTGKGSYKVAYPFYKQNLPLTPISV